MASATGTIGTRTDPAVGVGDALHALIASHAGWTFVEEFAQGAYTCRVYRCSGTSNSFGTNFHVFVYYNTTTPTSIRVAASEDYVAAAGDATTNKLVRPCSAHASSMAPNANSSFGDETNGIELDATSISYATLPCDTTSTDYFFVVTSNGIFVGIKFGTVDYAAYAGLFDSLLAADPFPLCVTGGPSAAQRGAFASSSVTVACSRHPGRTAVGTDNFKFSLERLHGLGGANNAVDLFHGAAFSSPMLLRHLGSVPATYGFARGQLKDSVTLGGAATRTGDYITKGTVQWWRMFLDATNPIYVNSGAA